MFMPAGRPYHDVRPRFHGCANVCEHSLRYRKIDTYVDVAQSAGLNLASQLKHLCNGVALRARDCFDLASHFSVTDESDLHARSFRISFSYRSMPSISSRLLIFSPAV